jgi:hypothetical protein
MKDYRAFTIGPDGHIDGSHAYSCANDEDAIVWAEQWLEASPIEVWSGERLVRRLTSARAGQTAIGTRGPRDG